jgi:hypothetical protein
MASTTWRSGFSSASVATNTGGRSTGSGGARSAPPSRGRTSPRPRRAVWRSESMTLKPFFIANPPRPCARAAPAPRRAARRRRHGCRPRTSPTPVMPYSRDSFQSASTASLNVRFSSTWRAASAERPTCCAVSGSTADSEMRAPRARGPRAACPGVAGSAPTRRSRAPRPGLLNTHGTRRPSALPVAWRALLVPSGR